MKRTSYCRLAVTMIAVIFSMLGCGAQGTDRVGSSPCIAYHTDPCLCPSGTGMGTQTCNAAGTGYTGPCAGSACGTSSGCSPPCSAGSTCRGNVCVPDTTGGCNPSCSPGYTCQSGTCVRDTPVGCNPPCSSGYHCEGTTCVRDTPAGCFLSPGTSCSTDSQCCGDTAHTQQGACVHFFGGANSCAALCATGSDCASGCCYSLSSGGGACGVTHLAPEGGDCSNSLCCATGLTCTGGRCVRPGPTCSLSPGATCSTDSQCCGDTAHTQQGACVSFFGGARSCAAFCTSGSGCASGCCYSLSGGGGACGATHLASEGDDCSNTLCCASGLICSGGRCTRPAPTCTPPGSSCSASGQCCGSSPSTFGTCANLFGTGYICHARCTRGTDCSSGCCYLLTDGTGACGTTLLATSGSWCDNSICCAGALICSSNRCR